MAEINSAVVGDARELVASEVGARQLPPLAVPAHRWTFLTNHAHVLILLSKNCSLVLREVALQVGITERAVQRIILDLESEGYIERARVGRKNQYRILANQALRHPIESHRSIGELIALVTNGSIDPVESQNTFLKNSGAQNAAPITKIPGTPIAEVQ